MARTRSTDASPAAEAAEPTTETLRGYFVPFPLSESDGVRETAKTAGVHRRVVLALLHGILEQTAFHSADVRFKDDFSFSEGWGIDRLTVEKIVQALSSHGLLDDAGRIDFEKFETRGGQDLARLVPKRGPEREASAAAVVDYFLAQCSLASGEPKYLVAYIALAIHNRTPGRAVAPEPEDGFWPFIDIGGVSKQQVERIVAALGAAPLLEAIQLCGEPGRLLLCDALPRDPLAFEQTSRTEGI